MFMVNIIWNTLQIASKLYLRRTPAAFQIRYRGNKGVVAIDSRLKGKVLKLRPSMWKFQSNQCDLEIVQYSKASEYKIVM